MDREINREKRTNETSDIAKEVRFLQKSKRKKLLRVITRQLRGCTDGRGEESTNRERLDRSQQNQIDRGVTVTVEARHRVWCIRSLSAPPRNVVKLGICTVVAKKSREKKSSGLRELLLLNSGFIHSTGAMRFHLSSCTRRLF